MAPQTHQPAGPTPGPEPTARLVSRDRLLIGLAILALIVAAFLLPPLGSAAGSGPGDGSGNGTDEQATPTPAEPETPRDDRNVDTAPGSDQPGDERPGDGSGSGTAGVSVRRGNGTGAGGDGEGLRVTGSQQRHPDCFLVVWDRLLPGREASVFLWNDGGPVGERTVWFDGESLGATSDAGRVDGRVPYVRDLAVTADVPPVDRCGIVHLDAETGYDQWRQERDGSPVVQIGDDATVEPVTPTGGNVTATLPVEGQADLAITGDPYPGESVRLNATVEDVPMRSATVRVDGERVGETDADGRYDLPVPDDGRETVSVSVSRGAFAAEETVDVLLLSVGLRTPGLFALPGDAAAVEATVGDRPAREVRVAVDGATVTTGPDGRAEVDLPSDPGAVVTARGYDQTATAAVWPLYVPTALAVLLAVGLFAGSFVGASRRDAGPGLRPIAAAWVVAASVLAGWVLGGPIGAGGVALVTLAGIALRYRRALDRALAGLRTRFRAGVRALHRLAIATADWLGRWADALAGALRALLARLAGLPRSVRPLLGHGLQWLAGLPGRLGAWALAVARTAAHEGRRALGRLRVAITEPRILATGGLAAAVAGVGLIAEDVPDWIGVGGGALLVVVGWTWHRRAVRTGQRTAGDRSTASSGATGAQSDDAGAAVRPTLRRLWRTFARWTVPGRWRSRTPGEVARTAVDRGFPREPVERLTEAFRAVEYGDRDLTEEEWGRARTAFEALRAAQSDEEGGEP